MLSCEPMRPEHWPTVRTIYLEGIATGHATFETIAPEWAEWDATHLGVGRLVAIRDGEVAGWAALSPVSRRTVYAGVAEISVYVAAATRGTGVGRMLMQAVIRESENAGIWTLQASVFPENLATLRLHEGAGFRSVGRRTRIGRHEGVWRDTVILERRSEVAGRD